MFSNFLINTIGLLGFLFILWKRLREDYHFEKIFSLAFYISIFFLASFIISKYFFPGYWFWIEVLGIILGFSLGIMRLKMRVWESFEGVFVGFLIWLCLIFLSDSVKNSSIFSFAAFWVSTFCVFLFFFFDSFYRRFSWYKSGRVGFSSLATSGILFLIRSVVALIYPNMISFTGKYEAIASGVVAFTAFLLLFNLSRK